MNNKKILHQIIRVDHAGEFGAIQIYKGQLKRFSSNHRSKKLLSLIQEMYETEKQHLDFFTKEMHKNHVRPTALLPIWRVLGYSLGYLSALLGPRGAMACTVAVEEAIVQHYQEQINLLKKLSYNLNRDEEKEDEFLNNLVKIRAEEMEHKEIGVEREARRLPFYNIANKMVKVSCKLAIFLSKRI